MNYESQDQTKKEQRELRKQEKAEERKKALRINTLKKMGKVALFVCATWIGVFGIGWLVSKSSPAISEGDVIARKGIHWHPELKIVIKGIEQEVPGGIGLAGAVHKPLHTHNPDGVIHMEFEGLVLKNDTRLGRFFENWGKEFSNSCVLEFCNGSEGTVKMLVNGESNGDFETYLMRDGDKIEIRYE